MFRLGTQLRLLLQILHLRIFLHILNDISHISNAHRSKALQADCKRDAACKRPNLSFQFSLSVFFCSLYYFLLELLRLCLLFVHDREERWEESGDSESALVSQLTGLWFFVLLLLEISRTDAVIGRCSVDKHLEIVKAWN